MKEGSTRWSPALEAALRAGLSEADDGSVHPAASPEARAAVLWGMASTRASDAWPRVVEAGTPVLLLLATNPPHGDQNRDAVGRFHAALPQATVSWVPDASHSLLVDAGPPLAADIADWLEAEATLRSRP